MTRSTKAWLLAALAALLWAQALGLTHRVVHASYAPLASHASQALQAPDSPSGHEAGSPECRLIDQLLQAHGLTSTKTPEFAADCQQAAPQRAYIAPAGSARACAWARGPPRA